jgi:hypothetical protein
VHSYILRKLLINDIHFRMHDSDLFTIVPLLLVQYWEQMAMQFIFKDTDRHTDIHISS